MPTAATSPISIALKANNGKYVTTGSAGAVLQAGSETLGPGENFQMFVQADTEIVALRAANGKYVSNPSGGTAPLAASADAVGATEQFTLEDWGPQTVVLLASSQKYIQLTGAASALQAGGDPASAAAFEVILLSEAGTPLPPPPVVEVTSSAASSSTVASSSDPTAGSAYTVCFCGTGCTRDEGEVSRPPGLLNGLINPGSDKAIYTPETGYIPVRIHREISGNLQATTPSVTVRGVGENDWALPRNNSEPLILDAPLRAPANLQAYASIYSGGDQHGVGKQSTGWSLPALALHGANLAAASGKPVYNFLGHSRGAVEAIMSAWFIYFYGPPAVQNIPINIFAIDPVPGPGEWFGIFTQLPPNVANYVGIYAWDVCGSTGDPPFMGLVPRPNGRMNGTPDQAAIYNSWWPNQWKYIADNYERRDPLLPAAVAQPTNYDLYACRGRHGTVAGNYTKDGGYNAANVSDAVARVPELIYKMARGYLTQWGTAFPTASAAQQRVLALRQGINTWHREFDLMGGGETRTSVFPRRPYVRRLSSISGSNPFNSYYMDDVVGDPPYKLAYPVTNERTNAGWVKWKFL